MIDLLTTEKLFVEPHLKPGGIAVDCTMGNGNDTLYLSRKMGEAGRVYAFDIQQPALDSTLERLRENGAPENYTLILDSHAELKKYVAGRPCAIMFNLGYLPKGDHTKTTLRPSTRAAIEASIDLLDDDGIILIAVYPGHEEGRLEGEMLDEMLSALDRRTWCATKIKIMNSPSSPFFFSVEKK